MLLSPMAGKMFLLGMLSLVWLFAYRRAIRMEPGQTYHLAADQRDRRKAKFYYQSVWFGLLVAFLSFVCLDMLPIIDFDSNMVREWAQSLIRAVGVWGLLLIGAVWMQVGTRVSQPNSDGQSLIPAPQPLDQKRK